MTFRIEYVRLLPATLTQLRANHNRVKPCYQGLALAPECLTKGVQVWIFSYWPQGLLNREAVPGGIIEQDKFHWMHTNIIRRIELLEGGITEVETESDSIYRLEYACELQAWATPEKIRAMCRHVALVRTLIYSEDIKAHLSISDISIFMKPENDGYLFSSWPIAPKVGDEKNV